MENTTQNKQTKQQKNSAQDVQRKSASSEMAKNYTHIPGWGIDADPDNEPTYPMKKYTGDDHKRLNWERPSLQEESVEVLMSVERPHLSATFGTVSPPSGLSGMIRRFAFKYSESTYSHWLPLMLADRVNVVEGILQDLSRGIVPNIFAEKGWKADWKYNKKGLAKNIAVLTLVTFSVIALVIKKKNKRDTDFVRI